jgi:hypothetical protein
VRRRRRKEEEEKQVVVKYDSKLGDGWSGDGMLWGWGRSDGMLCVVGGKRFICAL